MKRTVVISACLCAAGILTAGGPGTIAGLSLLRSGDVRSVAMGGSAVWLGGSAGAMYANPAGLSGVTGFDVSASYQAGFADSYLTTFNGATRLGPAAVGIGLGFYNTGAVDLMDSFGVVRTVSALSDSMFRIGAAVGTEDVFSCGATATLFSSRLVEEFTATALLFDAGALLRVGRFSVGVSLQNLGGTLTYDTAAAAVPLRMRGGIGYTDGRLAVGVEASKEPDTNIREMLGAEYRFTESFTVRAGYKIGYDTELWTLGFGASFGMIRVDYAFSFFTDTAAGHQIGFGASF